MIVNSVLAIIFNLNIVGEQAQSIFYNNIGCILTMIAVVVNTFISVFDNRDEKNDP